MHSNMADVQFVMASIVKGFLGVAHVVQYVGTLNQAVFVASIVLKLLIFADVKNEKHKTGRTTFVVTVNQNMIRNTKKKSVLCILTAPPAHVAV